MNKEEIQDLYINQNMTQKEICNIYNISSNKLNRFIKKHNIYKPKHLVGEINSKKFIKDNGVFINEIYNLVGDTYTFLEEYKGANKKILCRHNACGNEWIITPSHFFQGKRCNNKHCSELKHQETCLKKYGDKKYNNRESRKNTCLKKYGVETNLLLPDTRKKRRDRYVKDNPIVSSEQNIIDIINTFDYKPSLYELSRKIGCDYTTIHGVIAKYNLSHLVKHRESKINLYWKEKIETEFNVVLEKEVPVFSNKVQKCDLYYKDKKIAIDINPTPTHNTQWSPFTADNKSNISVDYHQRRAKEAEANGILLYQIFDWDDEDKIMAQLKGLFGLNSKIYARNCVLKEIDKSQEKTFLNKYHLKGYNGSKVAYGLFHNNELVAVMSFGKTRFRGSKAEWEIIRFATVETVVGGADKLFKGFVRAYNPESVITFSDFSKGFGYLYEKLGFKFYGFAGLNAQYAPIKRSTERHSTQTASYNFKKYGADFKTCKDFYNNKKWYRINDAGNKIWLWSKKTI